MNEKPVLLESILHDHIWGGDLLKDRFKKSYENRKIGESWELSAHEKSSSIVNSGIHKGMPFDKYYADVLGNDQACSILIKLIGSKKNLSIQVHPGDNFHEMKSKKEIWYIVSVPENGAVIAGINCDKHELQRAIENDRVEDLLCYVNCKAGDVVEISPGMVHAVMKDTIIYELQQNSDDTFRIYDWKRVDDVTGKPRELHIGHAMNVIDANLEAKVIPSQNFESQLFVKNDNYCLEKKRVRAKYEDASDLPCAYTIIDGSVEVFYKQEKMFEVEYGQTIYAPSGGVSFIGNATILKAIEAKDYI